MSPGNLPKLTLLMKLWVRKLNPGNLETRKCVFTWHMFHTAASIEGGEHG